MHTEAQCYFWGGANRATRRRIPKGIRELVKHVELNTLTTMCIVVRIFWKTIWYLLPKM